MTGKGLLACIDLAWIGLALPWLVWFGSRPNQELEAKSVVSLSSCQVASWHWALAWPGLACPGLQYELPAGLHSSVFSLLPTNISCRGNLILFFSINLQKILKDKVSIKNILMKYSNKKSVMCC